jgi:hypothetical protein
VDGSVSTRLYCTTRIGTSSAPNANRSARQYVAIQQTASFNGANQRRGRRDFGEGSWESLHACEW